MNLDPEIFGEPKCSVPVCERDAWQAGLCRGHCDRKRNGRRLDTPMRRNRRKGEPRGVCIGRNCSRVVFAREVCASHYRRRFTEKRPDWNRPLQPVRVAAKTKDLTTRTSLRTWERFSEQAAGLKRTVSAHLRTIVEEHVARMGANR